MTTKELIAIEEENLKRFINEREKILREQIDAKSEIEFLEAKDRLSIIKDVIVSKQELIKNLKELMNSDII